MIIFIFLNMKKLLFLVLILNFISINSQETKKGKRAERKAKREKRINQFVNPKGKWFFGADIGLNKIENYNINNSKTNFQGGFLAEYYLLRNISITTNFKYLETGLSFYQPEYHPSGMGFFSSTPHDEYSGTFRGNIISIPTNIKWEFRIIKNLKGYLKYGISFNQETKNKYSKYSVNITSNYDKFYIKKTGGIGLTYFINNNSAILIDTTILNGSKKGVIFNNYPQNLQNTLFSIGYKYSFSKKQIL